jgi:hypothetical protein
MTNTAGTDWVKNLYGGKGWNDKADLFLFLQCWQRALTKHGGFELRVNTDLSCEMVAGKHRGFSLSHEDIEEERRMLNLADEEADAEYRSLLAERQS